jgi:uncharacterized damage-inducible protein DinB
MTPRFLVFALAVVAADLPAQQQGAASEPLAAYLRRAFNAVAKDLVAAAELMPAQDYGYRPAGVVDAVRTFGALLDHITVVNSLNCAMAAGGPDLRASLGKEIGEKAQMIQVVKDVNAMCADFLGTQTDSSLSQVVSMETGKVAIKATRANAIIFTIVHSNEHYGNMVTYLRTKGIVPPASAAQAAPYAIETPPKR